MGLSLSSIRIRYHDSAILRAKRGAFGDVASGLTVTELAENQVDGVHSACTAIGHDIAVDRVRTRFRHGLKFFQLWCGESMAGTTWIVAGSGRYIDEVGWLLPLRKEELWVRDIFISPAFRGRRLMSSFLALIVAQCWPECLCVWSDVDWRNRPSMRAHMNAGFQVRARVRALDVAGRLLVRSPVMSWDEPVTEIEPQQRILWLRGDRLQRHLALIA